MKSEAGTLSRFLFYYFLFLFISIILLAVTNTIYPSTTQVPIIRYSLIGILMYSFFIIIEYRDHVEHSALTALLDITFFGKIISIHRAKNYDKPNLDIEVRDVFLFGLIISVVVVTVFSLYALFMLPSTLIPGYSSTPIPSLEIFQDDPWLIITTNLVFLSEVLIGSIFLYSVAFGTIVFDGALIGPAIVSAIGQGNYSAFFPHGILELLGTATAAGTGLLIFYAVATLLTIEDSGDTTYSRQEKFVALSIILLVILSVYAFVLAWPIEYTILISVLGGSSLPVNWFASVYLLDALIIIDYALVFNWIFRERFVSLVKVVFLLLYPGILLFTLTAGSSSFGTAFVFWSTFLLFIASLFLPVREICSKVYDKFRSRKVRFNLEKLLDEGFDFQRTIGRSMKPAIESGEILLTYRNMDGLNLHVGDIVSYRPSMKYSTFLGSKTVSHRVVELSEERMVTKGDNNSRTDSTASLGDVDQLIVGKLVHDTTSSAFKFVSLTNNAKLREAGEKLVSSYCDNDLIEYLVPLSRKNIFAVLALSLILSAMAPAIVLLI
jgi:uncharacterized membrane protein SpoIIM required for sporulation